MWLTNCKLLVFQSLEREVLVGPGPLSALEIEEIETSVLQDVDQTKTVTAGESDDPDQDDSEDKSDLQVSRDFEIEFSGLEEETSSEEGECRV